MKQPYHIGHKKNLTESGISHIIVPVAIMIVVAVIGTALMFYSAALTRTTSSSLPSLVTLSTNGLAASKLELSVKNPTAMANLAQLEGSANADLTAPIYTVIDKATLLSQPGMLAKFGLPANFNMHDYLSLNTYEANGQRNPDANEIPDIIYLQGKSTTPGLIKDVMDLSVAYYFTGNRAYAVRAADWLRAWFVAPVTRMNPNLTYAQLKVGNATGQGVIDAHNLPEVLDAVTLISSSHTLSTSDQANITAWFDSYLTWLTTSKQGQTEGDLHIYFNNRASWYRAQVVAIADYLHKTATAKHYALQGYTLITHQIAANGTQPEELIRGQEGEDPWNYSYLNLQALIQLAIASKVAGVDLYRYVNPAGASMATALNLLLPYDLGLKTWPGSLIFKDPKSGKILPVIQNATPQMSLLNLPEAILARIYTGDQVIRSAAPSLQPLPIARLEFPASE